MPSRKQSNGNSPETAERHPRVGFIFLRLFAALFLLLILILSAAVVLHRTLLNAYAPVILSQLSEQFRVYDDLDFTWDGYSIDNISNFTITGIKVNDIKSGLPLLTTDSMRINTSLLILAIKRTDPVSAVTSVTLYNPVVTLGKEEGKWNVGTLLEPSEREPFHFPGNLGVTVNNGKIAWLGGEISDGYPLRQLDFSNLNGTFRLGTQGGMGISLEGQIVGDGIEPSDLSITGNYDSDKLSMQINASIDTMDLEYVKAIAENIGLHDIVGYADNFMVSILIGPEVGERGYSILGQGTIRDGALNTNILDLSPHNLSGDIYFTHKSLFSPGLTGVVDGADATVSGHIADFSAPVKTIDLYVDAANVNPSFIKKFMPDFDTSFIGGSFDAKAAISNSADKKLEVVFSLSSMNMSLRTSPVQVTDFNGWYSDGNFVLSKADFGFFDGAAIASGTMDTSTDNNGYDFKIQLDNIPAQKLAEYFGPLAGSGFTPYGNFSGDISVTSQSGSAPRVSGIVNSENFSLPQLSELGNISATIPFEYSVGQVNVQGATAFADGMVLMSEGIYDFSDGFTGSVAVTVNRKDFFSSIIGIPVEGEFAIAGDIKIPLSSAMGFSGEAFLSNGRIMNLVVPNLSSRIEIDSDAIRIVDLGGIIGNGTLDGEFVIPFDRNQSAGSAGHISVSGLDISPLLPAKYSSVISTSMNLAGDVNYDGLRNKIILDMLLSENSARIGPNEFLTHGDGISIVADFPLGNISEASAVISGVMELKQLEAPIFQGRELTEFSERIVSRVTNLLAGNASDEPPGEVVIFPRIAGIFNIDANLSDILGDTKGHLEIVANNVVLPKFNLASADLLLESENGSDWTVDFSINAGDAGTIEISGGITRAPVIGDSGIALNTLVENSGLSGIFEAVGLPGYERSSGSISGSGSIGGTLGNPVVDEFVLNVGESEAFGIQITSGQAIFSLSQTSLNLTSLNLEGASGFRALGAGKIDLHSPSLTTANLVLRVDAFDLQVISTATGKDFPVSGTASATVQLTQDAMGPKVLYDAGIENLSYLVGAEYIPLGNLSLSAVGRPGADIIDISEMSLTRDSESILVTGTIPSKFDILDQSGLNLSLDTDTGYTIPVPKLASDSGIGWSGGFGPTHLTLTGGVLGFSGEIGMDIRDLKYYNETVAQAMSGTIDVQNSVMVFSPDKVGLAGTDWMLGFDGRFDLTKIIPYFIQRSASFGNISFVQMTQAPIRLAGPGFEFSLVPGTGADAINVDVTGDRDGINLTASGFVSINGGQVDISRLPAFQESDTSPVDQFIKFLFNIRTSIASNLRVQQGNMLNVIFGQGDLVLQGSIFRPVLTGKIIANEGWIDILGNHFVLIEPLEFTFTSFNSIADPRVKATAQAQLRNVQSPGSYGEDFVITASIDGQLSRLLDNLHLTSEPPMSEDSLIAALAYEDVIIRTIGDTILGNGTISPGFNNIDITGMSLSFATSYLSRHIRQKAGLSDFEISLDERQNLFIYVEKEVFDNVVMYYSQSFGPDQLDNYLFGARYRWRPRSWVGLEINNDEEVTSRVQYIIPLR